MGAEINFFTSNDCDDLKYLSLNDTGFGIPTTHT